MSASPQREGDGDPEVAPTADDSNDAEQNKAQDTDPDAMQDPDALYAIEVKEQDRWLPIANVARIMKTALPDNAKIAKEAKECMQECVSEFISFITSEASEKCQQEKRKTVNGEDILFAMASLGFENYGEALKSYLARYREANVAKNEQNRPPSSYDATGSGIPTVGGAAEEPGHVQPGPEASEQVLGVPSAVDPGVSAIGAGLAPVGDAHDLASANANFQTDGFGDGRPELDVENPAAPFPPAAPVDEVATTNGDSIKLDYARSNPVVAPELTEAETGPGGQFKYPGPPDTTY